MGYLNFLPCRSVRCVLRMREKKREREREIERIEKQPIY